MNADAFRHLYNYHFAENRKTWEYAMQLSDEQFTRNWDYSRGSVLDQLIHIMSCDQVWFSGLSRVEIPEDFKPEDFTDRESIRTRWDALEASMRDYLEKLQDTILFNKPLEGEDKDLIVWQVLLHVVNHGTDHRAQLLRLLNDLGVQTTSQDYVFYIFDHS
jgi:uncharacterized damage-inducible protein DinB